MIFGIATLIQLQCIAMDDIKSNPKRKELLKKAKQLYAETRGAYFTIRASNCGTFWKLSIDSLSENFEGKFKAVLISYIDFVTVNRVKTQNTNKPYKL